MGAFDMAEQPQPNVTAMRQHVEHLFGGWLDGYHDGLIELAWTETTPDAAGRYRLKHARLFGTDQIDELIEEAARLNRVPYCNTYLGAALRHPNTAPFGRTNDGEAWALTAVYVDLDTADAVQAARDKYKLAKPTMIVVTGRAPHTRAQLWWRLESPLDDPATWPELLSAMADNMDGDTTVTNPSRVMRLAGSIAWPVKAGRQAEVTEIVPLREPGLALYAPEYIQAALCPAGLRSRPVPGVSTSGIERKANSLGLPGRVQDGRERYMRDVALAVMGEYIGTNGCVPTPQELFELAWPQYERNTDFSRPGRGPEEFAEKCRYAVQRFERGEIRGMRTLDEAVATYQKKVEARARATTPAQIFNADTRQRQPEAHTETDEPVALSDLKGEPKPREWFVEEWVPAGSVTALYGDGGTGKTLLAQQLLVAADIGGKWCGIDVPQTNALGVFCEDDHDELHRRHNAICASMGLGIGAAFNGSRIWPRVGHENLLVTFDKNNLPALSPFFARIMDQVMAHRVGFLVLDTAADLFGGNEIIRAQVNHFIKSVCGGFIRAAKDKGWILTVLLLAHPSQSGRNSGSGESGSTAWNNAVRSRLYLTRDEQGGGNDRILTRMKSNYAAAGQDQCINLEWREGALVPRRGQGQGFEWPERDTCEAVLQSIEEAWASGRPWSNAVQTRSEGRYAPRHMQQRHGIAPALAEHMIEQWLMNGILTVEMRGSHSKIKGLKVTGSIA
jgi:RecA-family ATPase